MDRAEAEAIYDAGREVCVDFILELAGRVEQHEDRLARLEAQTRQDSRTSSLPPSSDRPKSRAQRRAEARAKAKELMSREGQPRQAGGQPGHRGAGRELRPEDQIDEIVDHYPEACGACGHRFAPEQRRPGRRFGRHQVCELRRSVWSGPSIALIGCDAVSVGRGPAPGCRPRLVAARLDHGCRPRS